jgi:hypothetical protein
VCIVRPCLVGILPASASPDMGTVVVREAGAGEAKIYSFTSSMREDRREKNGSNEQYQRVQDLCCK